MTRPKTRMWQAFTLVELLMTIAIIGALVAILLPAIQSARESSRRAVCFNRTRQISLATLNYADTRGDRLPAMWQSSRAAPWANFSWRAALLPYIEEQTTFDRLEPEYSPLAPGNLSLIRQPMSSFQCPSTPESPRRVDELGAGTTRNRGISAGAHDLTAVFNVIVVSPVGEYLHRGAWHGGRQLYIYGAAIPEVPIGEDTARERAKSARLKNIKDGLSHTALLVEQAGKPEGRGDHPDAATHPPSEGAWATCDYGRFWGDGVNTHNYRDPFGFHGGATMALCDGSVTLLPEGIPRPILVALFTRDASEIIAPTDWKH